MDIGEPTTVQLKELATKASQQSLVVENLNNLNLGKEPIGKYLRK